MNLVEYRLEKSFLYIWWKHSNKNIKKAYEQFKNFFFKLTFFENRTPPTLYTTSRHWYKWHGSKKFPRRRHGWSTAIDATELLITVDSVSVIVSGHDGQWSTNVCEILAHRLRIDPWRRKTALWTHLIYAPPSCRATIIYSNKKT